MKSAARFVVALCCLPAVIPILCTLAADSPKSDDKKDAAKVEAKSDSKSDEKKPEIKIIKPADAKEFEGKEVAVEFKVASAREVDSGVCFLNSSNDRNDPKRFTGFITRDCLKKLKADPKTEKPGEYFANKTVRVTGKIKIYNKQFEIEVSSPDQIKIVEEEKKGDKAESKK